MSAGNDYALGWTQARHDRVNDPAECGPDEVEFTVRWRSETVQELHGSVTAWNVSGRAWRITGKPTPFLVTATGQEVLTRHEVTLEARFRDWVIVQPGAAVSAPLSISGWDGTELADYFLIGWPGGRKPADVQGPTHPAQREDRPVVSSSSWFAPLNLSAGPPISPLGGDLASWDPPRAERGRTDTGESGREADELATFVLARLDDTRNAVLTRHRARCGTPSSLFALDENGDRFAVPPCACDRDVRRTLGEISAQEQVVAVAVADTTDTGRRILRLQAAAHADHPDYRHDWQI